MTTTAMAHQQRLTDEVIETIAHYVLDPSIGTQKAYDTARVCLADSLGCAILSLRFKECTKLLGPVVPGTTVPYGSRVPGTTFVLDPIRAAFNIGTMIRWLDYNDTWLAAEWGHPSDNLGGILAVADYLSRKRVAAGQLPLTVRDVFNWMIRAHEIQGCLALANSFNRIGFDHVILVKVATTAVVTGMLGGSEKQIADAVSNAWIDVGPLRTYRHYPNTGSRKSWAAGDATSRGVMFAMMTMQGEMGYPHALTAPKWGFYDVLFHGKQFDMPRELGSYVMENVLFKISFPAEFHAQTAIEAAIELHAKVRDRLDEIASITITTHESAIRIIDKSGQLKNPADRDHCLQYIVAIGLIFGALNADHYEEETAKDPRIDNLRNLMIVEESEDFTRDYYDPEKRSIANALTVKFKDGTTLPTVTVEFPLGHRHRRGEGIPLLMRKFDNNLQTRFSPQKTSQITTLFSNPSQLDSMPFNTFMDMFVQDA